MLHPLDLRDISRNSTCLGTVARWWRRFHRIDMKLSDFEHVFMDKFDTAHRDKYSVVTDHDVQQCKVRLSKVQRSDKVGAPGFVNFIPAVAYHFYSSLPAAFAQPRV